MKKRPRDPDMLPEYDFSGGVRGKYAKGFAEGTNLVVIDPDVARFFPDHDAVNEALRTLLRIRNQPPKRPLSTARKTRDRAA